MRYYRVLLRAYPRAFRRLYGDELESDARALAARARAEGWTRYATFQLGFALDTIRSGLRERMAGRGYRVGRSRLRLPERGVVRAVLDLPADLRHAARALARAPAYSAAVVTTLSLGIGATTALFSVAYGTLLRPLPFLEGDRLVHLVQEVPALNAADGPLSRAGFSVADLTAYRTGVAALAEVSEYHSMVFTLIDDGGPHRVRAGVVSSNYFDFLGLRALHGRVLDSAEDRPGADPVIVLAHGYWLDRFGGDPGVIGRRVRMNDRVHEIVGVLPPTSQFPVERDLFLPTTACPTRSDPAFIDDPSRRMMFAYGRLADGATLEQASSEAATVLRARAAARPDAYPVDDGFDIRVEALRDEMAASVRPLATALLTVAFFLLLIACANAAGLALARARRRSRELAVRSALGAGRGRLVRTLVTEGVVLALVGGVFGLLVAVAAHDLLVGFASRFSTRAQEIQLDRTVLAFTLVTSVATGLVFGAVPGLWLGRARGGTGDQPLQVTQRRRDRRWQSTLVVGQVAVAYAVVVLAGLAARTAWVVGQAELGYETASVGVLEIAVDFERYQAGEHDRELFDALSRRLESHASVERVVRTVGGPLAGHRHRDAYFIDRADGTPLAATALSRFGEAGLFEVLGVTLLEGRGFEATDRPDGPRVAVVNRTFRDRFLGSQPALGVTLTPCHGPGECAEPLRVVGVVEDVRYDGPDEAVVPEVYQVGTQSAWAGEHLLVQYRGDAAGLAADLTDLVRTVDPELAVAPLQPLDHLRREHNRPRRFLAFLLASMAAVAMGLALTGIVGVASLAAASRTRELGIRRVLGADAGGLRALVLREGLVVTGLGLAGGVALTWLAGRALVAFLERVLWGVPPHDPAVLVGAAVLLGLTSTLAAWLPARRAGAVDVVEVLSEAG